MPLPETDTRLLRFSFLLAGVLSACAPLVGSDLKLTGEPMEAEGSLAFRDKLSGPLIFEGDDYKQLLDIHTSTDRCLPIGLVLEGRTYIGAPWLPIWQGVFKTGEIAWDYDQCTASVSPTTDDTYRLLLENWDQEINLLDIPDAGPTMRQQVTADLATLSAGTFIEFLRIDANEQADYVGVDGWATFLTNTSWISGSGTQSGTRSRDVLLFRYRLPAQAMTPTTGGGYQAVDLTGIGWEYFEQNNTTPPTVDYVKAPTIAGFKPYKIGTYNDWNDPLNGSRTKRYGDQLLVLPANQAPQDFGFPEGAYLPLTGNPFGQSLAGVYSQECGGPGGTLNLRRNVANNVCKSLWWKFGEFKFGRCFPLPDAIRFVLGKLAAPIVAGIPQPVEPRLLALVPPSNGLLSTFYTADTNPATLDSGPANEVPRLVVSAASDVKRYGASEAADRLMISPKVLITEACTLHDLIYFVDPVTGFFRMEHRAYGEDRYGAGSIEDLRTYPKAILPRAYTTRQQELPRYEDLTVANAQTVEAKGLQETYEINYGTGRIDYGPSGCSNSREGQNRSTRSVSRLSGDVAAMVLSGDSIPDNALAIMAPDATGKLSDANRSLAASRLLQRYHLRGRAAYLGTVNGLPVVFDTLKPQWEQPGQSVYLCNSQGLSPTARLTTRLGSDGRMAKRELNLKTQVLTLTVHLPIPNTDRPATLPTGRQFDNSFERSFW